MFAFSALKPDKAGGKCTEDQADRCRSGLRFALLPAVVRTLATIEDLAAPHVGGGRNAHDADIP